MPGRWASLLWLATKAVADLQFADVIRIDEKHLSSKDEGPEMLSFAASGIKEEFWLLLISKAL